MRDGAIVGHTQLEGGASSASGLASLIGLAGEA
jgi:hypothetical protein